MKLYLFHIKKITVLILICILISGCTNYNKQRDIAILNKYGNYDKQQNVTTEENTKEINYIKFFYQDHNSTYWLIEEKKMDINDLKSIVGEIINDKRNSIPKNTKVLYVNIKNGIAYVNLSKDFNCPDCGDVGLLINLRIIVHTLCLNDSLNINGVRFLLDGDEVMSIGGADTADVITSDLKLLPI